MKQKNSYWGSYINCRSLALPTDISNPNYMDVGYKSSSQSGWSYTVSNRQGASSGHMAKDTTTGNTSPKKTAHDHSVCSPTGKLSSPTWVHLDISLTYTVACSTWMFKEPLLSPLPRSSSTSSFYEEQLHILYLVEVNVEVCYRQKNALLVKNWLFAIIQLQKLLTGFPRQPQQCFFNGVWTWFYM